MDLIRLSFGKTEHLCGELRINKLFEQGKSFFVYPLRICWLLAPQTEESSVQVMISVPKKKIRKAVQRNRTRRLIKEAYRLHKSSLSGEMQEKNLQLMLAFIWMSEQVPEYKDLELKMQEALRVLRNKIT
ncbi:MAG: ribonuclease P protein component [Bacteroidales bacterium]|nr:ribonuclease P protein component [Bacteroidales bacterium]MDD3430564.1 ribonuclease P protein component [Bacteroidales bacterium]MDD4361108.1 ribonuclease P protein component [Bacteroidales bacterium]MDD4429947.1 ribonuclease P protein component [Bacteroidales bacterium]